MPITTTIARHFAWRCLLISIGSLVLGVWGVYDYAWSIPARERAFERGQVSRTVRDALEPGRWSEQAQPAREAVQQQLTQMQQEHFSEVSSNRRLSELDDQELEEFTQQLAAGLESMRERHDESWFAALLLFNQALESGEPRGHPLIGIHLAAYEVADRAVQETANVKQPRVYDRPIQWAFILCLPFVPLYLWFYVDTKRRVYRLDEDGTLHMPEGTWRADEIADIDMSMWMKKSIAYVVHKDGRRAKLDDYKHRNLHLIIGGIASRLYPEQWDIEAKMVKKEQKTEEPAEEQAVDAGSA